jgi:F-type H+-transporting ATPase subunit b
MIDIDISVLIQIANFLLLLFLLNIIVYRPIRGILNRRKEEMSAIEENAQDLRHKANKFSEELEDNMSEMRKEGLRKRENLKGEGIEQEKEILQDAYSSIQDKINRTRTEIHDKISEMRLSLQPELEGFSQELAEKILGRDI